MSSLRRWTHKGRALFLLWLGACADPAGDPAALEWAVSFANPETARPVVRVDLSIVRDHCSSDDFVYEASLGRAGKAPLPPPLEAGPYALRGTAVTVDCLAVAYGCVQTQVPVAGDATIQVVLEDIEPLPVCSGSCAERCADAGGSP